MPEGNYYVHWICNIISFSKRWRGNKYHWSLPNHIDSAHIHCSVSNQSAENLRPPLRECWSFCLLLNDPYIGIQFKFYLFVPGLINNCQAGLLRWEKFTSKSKSYLMVFYESGLIEDCFAHPDLKNPDSHLVIYLWAPHTDWDYNTKLAWLNVREQWQRWGVFEKVSVSDEQQAWDRWRKNKRQIGAEKNGLKVRIVC